MQSVAITTDKDNRDNFKNKLLSKVEMALTPPTTVEEVEPEIVEVEIIDKYSTWVPARLALESDELLSDYKKDEAYVPQHELEERVSVKNDLLNKVAVALVPVEVVEPAPVEIIEKYSSWTPARLSLQPTEVLSPEYKPAETVVFPREAEKRVSIKQNLLNKVETSLNPPLAPVKPEPAPLEIIEKYSDWTAAGFDLGPEEVYLPEGKKDELFIPLREVEKREGIKHNLLNKVEESLTPVEVIEPAPIEIVDKYANWAPARLAIEPEEVLSPEFKAETTVILPLEIEKRVSIKQNLLNKLETSLIPVPVEIEQPIEIIEKYTEWTPAGFALEAAEALLPEGKKDDKPFVLFSEQEKRADIKHSLSNKVEEALVPPVLASEPAPIEILDKYATWVPARLSLEPQEVLSPEFKNDELVLSPHEQEKKEKIESSLSSKVDESLIPPAPEPAPIEIVEKYSNWAPARLSLEPQDVLSPEFTPNETVVFPREQVKRVEIKQSLSNKVEEALVPPVSVPAVEPESIEIIDKYSMGIPQHPMEDTDPIFPEARRILAPTALNTDVPQRLNFKENLLKKVNTLPVVVEKSETVEIVGEYSQRTVTPYGLDYEEVNKTSVVALESTVDSTSRLQESIADFKPVTEEPVVPVLRLPENYGELEERALYGVLIQTSNLRHTSETANLTLDVLAGRSNRAVEFEIVETPKPVVIQPVAPVIKAPVVLETYEPEPLKIEVKKPVVVKEPELVEFDLPSDWASIPLSVLRTDLLSTGATPEQVDAQLAILTVKKPEQVLTVETSKTEEPAINLPEEFKSWKPSSQYLYLTKELKTTPELANSIIWEFNSEN